ncbi:MAG: DUF5661 family protein [Methanogenium sp.]|jgi:hypothetical protein
MNTRRMPIRNVSTISENTKNILEALQKQGYSNNVTPPPEPYYITNDNQIPFKQALASGKYTPVGMGLWQSAAREDYGKIWVKKTIVDEKTGAKQEYLVVYTNDDDEIIRQVASEYGRMQKAAYIKKANEDKVPLQLVGQDGNAFAILGRFQSAARKAGWDKERIKAVMDEAMSGDYNNLLVTMMKYTYDPTEEDYDEFDDYDELEMDDDSVVSSKKTAFNKEIYTKYPNYRKYFFSLQRLKDTFYYGRPMIIQNGSQYLMRQHPELDEVEANKIVNIWLGEGNPYREARTAAAVDPKNIPIAPGIKSKNLSLDESGGAGTGTVTVEFTDVNKALKFYQEDVAGASEGKEPAAPEGEEKVDVNEELEGGQVSPPPQVPPQQGQQPPIPQVQPKASSLNKKADDDSYHFNYYKDEDETADQFGQFLHEGDRVKDDMGRRGQIDRIVGDAVYVIWGGPFEGSENENRSPVLMDAKQLTKWSNLKSTVASFSDGIKGVKVIRYSNYNPNFSTSVWQLLNRERTNTHAISKYSSNTSYINENGMEIPISLRKGIKVGEMFERPDNHELVRFAGWIEKTAVNDNGEPEDDYNPEVYEEDNDDDLSNELVEDYKNKGNEEASIDIHVEAEPSVIEEILDTIMEGEDEELKGGLGDNKKDEEFDQEQLAKGKDVEKEHTNDEDMAKEIAKDHLTERGDYYDKLEDMEKKESNLRKKSDHYQDPNFGLWVASLGNSLQGEKKDQYHNILAQFLPEFGHDDYSEIVQNVDQLQVEQKKQLESHLYDLIGRQEFSSQKLSFDDPYDTQSDFHNDRGSYDQFLTPPDKELTIGDKVRVTEESTDMFGEEGVIADKLEFNSYRVNINGEDYRFYKDELTKISYKTAERNNINKFNTGDVVEFKDGGEVYTGEILDVNPTLGGHITYDIQDTNSSFPGGGISYDISEKQILRKISYKTAADISDQVPPMSNVTDESRTDSPAPNQQPLPPKQELNNMPGDVLYDSNQKEQGAGKFQVTTDPTEKTVTVKFLEQDKEQALNNLMGNPQQQPNPLMQPAQNPPALVPGQEGFQPQKDFQDTNSGVQF